MEMQTQIRRRWKRSSHWNLRKNKGGLTEQANRLCQLGKMQAAHDSHLSDSQRVPNSSCKNADMPTHSLPLSELPSLPPPSLPSPKAASVTFSSTSKKAFSFPPKISTHKIKKDSPLSVSPSLTPSLSPSLLLSLPLSPFFSMIHPTSSSSSSSSSSSPIPRIPQHPYKD